MAVRYPEFQQLNTEVLAIDTDSVLAHKVWNEIELTQMVPGGIPYSILSDRNGDIGKAYGVYDPQKGKSIRGTFIIDPQGFVHAAEGMTGPVGRNPDEILRQLKAYQQHLSTGDAIPCGWQPGDMTFSPDMERAGQVWKLWQPQ